MHQESTRPDGPAGDPRPPDSYGLSYIGVACTAGDHADCDGYWPVTLATYPGRGTRCACPCHTGRPSGGAP